MEKEKRTYEKGLWRGLAIGIIFALAVIFAGIKIFCMISGNAIVLGSKNASIVNYTNVLDKRTVEKVDELTEYLDVYYYEEYDKEKVQESLLDGLVAGSGDVYTMYYTPEEYEDLQINTTGNYYGIGAGLTQDVKTMVVTVSKVYEGTPAEEAGLLKDDIIVSVDGVDATSMELSKLVQLIRGEEGTTVDLAIYRSSTQEELEFIVPRRNVQLPSVSAEMLSDNIGYIQIAEFQSNTASQFCDYLTMLEQEGMHSLIVDLRDNPGGLLSSVVNILDVILPEGTVVYTEDKYGNRDTYKSDGKCIDYPMVVLVNGNSASASEIFAGAIKDYDYGTLLGTTTFGKGIVQTIFPLEDGDALKITTAKYYTPEGYNIHGAGIEPDVELEYEFLGPEGESYDKQYDNQLQEAIKMLSSN